MSCYECNYFKRRAEHCRHEVDSDRAEIAELRARAERAEFLLREVVHEDCWLAIVPQIREFLGDAPDAGGGK